MSKQSVIYDIKQLKRVLNPHKTRYVLMWAEAKTREQYNDMTQKNKFMKDPSHPFSSYKKYLAYHKRGHGKIVGEFEA